MRISDWSSDVCSSDLRAPLVTINSSRRSGRVVLACGSASWRRNWISSLRRQRASRTAAPNHNDSRDRKSVVSGKSGSVRVDLGGRRLIKKKNVKTMIFTLSTHQNVHTKTIYFL